MAAPKKVIIHKKPKATIQYQQPAGPARPTAGQQVKQAVGGWLNRGIQNFAENARSGLFDNPPPRAPPRREREPGKRRGTRRERESQSISPAPFQMPDFGGGIDMSMHPDPMYQGMGRGSHKGKGREGAREVITTRTVTRYRD